MRSLKGKVRWIGNPLADVVRCFRKLYPHCSADISVQPVPPELKGQCSFGDASHPVPLITIDPSLPYAGCIDVLAHELAHVAAGENGGHGPEWEAAYAAIHDEYFAFVTRAAKRAGVEPAVVRLSESPPPSRIGPTEPDDTMVICPVCTSQFRAIPLDVQRVRDELLAVAKRYAAECRLCGGHGVRRRLDLDGTPLDDVSCEQCADVRLVIARAEGRADG